MHLISWILFIVLAATSISFFFLLFSFIIKKDDQSSTPLSLINYLIIALTFYISKEIFQPHIAAWIWKISSISYFVFFLACSIWYYNRVKLQWKITLIISLLLCIVPLIINLQLYELSSSSYLSIVTNEFPKTIFSFWLPILILSIIILLSYTAIQSSQKSEQFRFFKSVLDQEKKTINKEYSEKTIEIGKFKDFQERLIRSFTEDVQYRLDSILRRQQDMNRKLLADYELNGGKESSLNLNKLEEAIRSLGVELKTNNVLPEEKPKTLYSTPDNQIFIREIYHYLATPLAQIESLAESISASQATLLDSPDAYRKYMALIKNSVDICKSVLLAYREVAYISSSSEWSPQSLHDSVLSACNLYSTVLNKEEIQINCNIDTQYLPYTNNFLLATLLPLIENAIAAMPINGQLNINSTSTEQEYKFTIQNNSINEILLSNLTQTGYSSKPNYEGTGISIARHLIEDQTNGILSYNVDGNTIETLITLSKTKIK